MVEDKLTTSEGFSLMYRRYAEIFQRHYYHPTYLHIFTPDTASASKQQQQQLLLRCGSCVWCKDVQVHWLLAVHDGCDSQILTLIVVCGCPIEREDQEHRHDELSMIAMLWLGKDCHLFFPHIVSLLSWIGLSLSISTWWRWYLGKRHCPLQYLKNKDGFEGQTLVHTVL